MFFLYSLKPAEYTISAFMGAYLEEYLVPVRNQEIDGFLKKRKLKYNEEEIGYIFKCKMCENIGESPEFFTKSKEEKILFSPKSSNFGRTINYRIKHTSEQFVHFVFRKIHKNSLFLRNKKRRNKNRVWKCWCLGNMIFRKTGL